jgi:hypothetical protein
MKRLKNAFSPGSHVTWTGGENGVVRKVFTHRIERTMKGATVIQPANRKNPAYLIEQAGGDTLFMRHNELKAP